MARTLRPALGDRLAAGVEAHTIRTVGMQVAEQRTLPATKAVVSHRHRQRYVDADHADFDLVAEQARRFTVTGEDAGAVAILVIVDQLHRLFQAIDPNNAQHRPEDLFFIDAHFWGDVVEQAATQEESFLMTGHGQTTTVHYQGRTGCYAVFHITADLVSRLTGDQRAHVQTAGRASTDFQRLDLGNQFGYQRICDLVTDTHGYRNGHAALTARTVSRAHQCTDSVVQIRIRHQHRVVLRTTQGLDALAALGAFAIDVLGDRRRTHEAQCLDFRRFDQCVHRRLVTVHHAEYALRQAGFEQ
ncbi:hypothetical protein D3C76_1054870 [compost metagenome]